MVYRSGKDTGTMISFVFDLYNDSVRRLIITGVSLVFGISSYTGNLAGELAVAEV